jgi:Domain of unknown function (DUF4434)/Domain of unknown function (DUF5109)
MIMGLSAALMVATVALTGYLAPSGEPAPVDVPSAEHEDDPVAEQPIPDGCATGMRLSGTFLQPHLAADWSVADWTAEFNDLRQACITEVVLQWTADSRARTAVYDTSLAGYTQPAGPDVVANALVAAESAGIQVYLGLQTNDDWWQRYSGDSEWLAGEAAVARALLADLAHRYAHHQALAGWYVPFEVDNWHHTTRAEWDSLSSFYAAVSDRARALTPELPLIIAPFFNPAGGLPPAEWTEMWTAILSGGHVDVIALQDGVGAGNTITAQLATWFAATRDAIDRAGGRTQLWADTETFTPEFQPMPIRDVVANMAAVNGYVSRYWSFSYNHYQSPRQAGAAHHQAYLAYLTRGAVD